MVAVPVSPGLGRLLAPAALSLAALLLLLLLSLLPPAPGRRRSAGQCSNGQERPRTGPGNTGTGTELEPREAPAGNGDWDQ